MPIRAVIFDMDGTLTKPFFDWARMKAAMGLPPDRPILESMEALAPDARARCEAQLETFENEAARASELNPGVREALDYLARRGLKTAILTRNSARSVDLVLARHGLAFDTVVTRHCAPPKPAPDALFLIARRLGEAGRAPTPGRMPLSPPGRGQGEGSMSSDDNGSDPHPTLSLKGRGVSSYHPAIDALRREALSAPLDPAEMVMVGDFEFDILSGRRAGCRTILVTNGVPNDFPTRPDAVIETLHELPTAIAALEQ